MSLDPLVKFSDEKWRELISSMGLRVHIREALKKVIKAEEKAALSQLHRRGLPKQPQEKTEKLVMHPRITSFARRAFEVSNQVRNCTMV